MALPWKRGAPRVAFITGGGSGIGREFARRLAAEGASVAIFNRRLAPGVIAELQSLAPGQRFESYAADVSDEVALQVAFTRAVCDLGPPDLVINSAGIIVSAPFEDLSGADFERVVQVNLTGARNVSAVALPHLRTGSHLVLVASLAGLVGSFGYAAYSASKFGVVGLARVLEIELRLGGIDVSVCCPGVILTPMVAHEQMVEHPVTRGMAEFPGVIQVGPACDAMLRGIARRRFQISAGLRPRMTAYFDRHFPGPMRAASRIVAQRLASRQKK